MTITSYAKKDSFKRLRFHLSNVGFHAVMAEDKLQNAVQLDEKYYPNGDDEHLVFGRSEWRFSVSSEEALIGHWDWVEYQIEDDFAVPAPLPDFLDAPDLGPELRQIIVEAVAESSATKTPGSEGEISMVDLALRKLAQVGV